MTSDKRELAIKYLTEEIRSLRMAPQINGCGPENWAEQLEVMETCLEAVRGHGNQPLTLEQLRKMDGNPVWVEFEDGSGGLWGVVHISVFEQIIFPNGLHCTIGHPYYGKIYKAYAYHPAHIDLEAWVSVEDRLPEDNKDGETVLVIVSGKPHENITLHRAIMTAGYFQGEGWVVNEYPEWESPEVTYWMPLPEPPGSCPLEGQS